MMFTQTTKASLIVPLVVDMEWEIDSNISDGGVGSSIHLIIVKSGLFKEYIQDRASAPISVTKSELEQYLEEP